MSGCAVHEPRRGDTPVLRRTKTWGTYLGQHWEHSGSAHGDGTPFCFGSALAPPAQIALIRDGPTGTDTKVKRGVAHLTSRATSQVEVLLRNWVFADGAEESN